MEYQSSEDLMKKLATETKLNATEMLTEFYAKARFEISDRKFSLQYTDGANDGGIDFYYREDDTFYIFQTKFSGKAKKVSDSEILA